MVFCRLVLLYLLNRISETVQVTDGRMLASPGLDHGHPTFLWQRTTPVIVGCFAGRTCKNNNKRYT